MLWSSHRSVPIIAAMNCLDEQIRGATGSDIEWPSMSSRLTIGSHRPWSVREARCGSARIIVSLKEGGRPTRPGAPPLSVARSKAAAERVAVSLAADMNTPPDVWRTAQSSTFGVRHGACA